MGWLRILIIQLRNSFCIAKGWVRPIISLVSQFVMFLNKSFKLIRHSLSQTLFASPHFNPPILAPSKTKVPHMPALVISRVISLWGYFGWQRGIIASKNADVPLFYRPGVCRWFYRMAKCQCEEHLAAPRCAELRPGRLYDLWAGVKCAHHPAFFTRSNNFFLQWLLGKTLSDFWKHLRVNSEILWIIFCECCWSKDETALEEGLEDEVGYVSKSPVSEMAIGLNLYR